ncbi:MAG TPA: nucleotidyltransferase family protein [Chloroflexota bacterium]|nr:nucleotidyltransferase family protein [Chloroflexota bacterium]
MIAGMVLAAGASRRLGQPKQLLPLGGRPLLSWSLAAMRAFAPRQLVVVLGHEAPAIRAALDLQGVTVVVNERYAAGLSTSLQAGIAALDPAIEATLVSTGDQPLVSDELLRQIAAAHETTGQPLVATDYGDHLGVPLLLARSAWPLVRAIEGDQGARALLRLHPEWVASVPVPDPSMALDVDTFEQYEQVCSVVEQRFQ